MRAHGVFVGLVEALWRLQVVIKGGWTALGALAGRTIQDLGMLKEHLGDDVPVLSIPTQVRFASSAAFNEFVHGLPVFCRQAAREAVRRALPGAGPKEQDRRLMTEFYGAELAEGFVTRRAELGFYD